MTFRYRQRAKVMKVWQPTRKVWIEGVGNNAVFEDVPMGWHILIAGSNEGLHVGDLRPDIEVGDLVDILVKKVELKE